MGKVFRTTLFGGFNKKDVIAYLDKLSGPTGFDGTLPDSAALIAKATSEAEVKASEKIAAAAKSEANAWAEVHEQIKHINELTREIADQDDEISKAYDEAADAHSALLEAQEQLELANQRIQALEAEKQEMARSLEEAAQKFGRIDELTHDLAEKQDEVSKVYDELADVHAALDDAREQLEAEKGRSAALVQEKLLMSAAVQAAQAQADRIEELTHELAEKNDEIVKVYDDLADTNAALTDARKQLRVANERAAALQSNVQLMEKAINEPTKPLEGAEVLDALKKADDEVQSISQQLAEAAQRMQALEAQLSEQKRLHGDTAEPAKAAVRRRLTSPNEILSRFSKR